MSETSPEFNSPSPEQLSSLLPGYKVETLVSCDVSGAVYEASQISLDRKVTIKVLPPEIGKDADLSAAFEAEAKTMARLRDPNLVGVFDFGNIDGMLFIIMENVPGRSLHEATHGNRVDQKESARLVADICHGLHHAHNEGVVHRALTPRNILINNEAQPKIVDFGLASLFTNRSAESENPYAAPETMQPGARVDFRADIYSAGMILYDLVVGHLPGEPYKPPTSVRNCRPEIDSIIYRAIQSDPAQRYASADNMARDLETMLEKMGKPPTQQAFMSPATVSLTAGRLPVRHAPLPASKPSSSGLVITLLIVAVGAGIAILVVSSGSSGPEKKTTQSQPGKPAVTPPQKKPAPPKKRIIKQAPPKPEIAAQPDRPPPTPPEKTEDADNKAADAPATEPKQPAQTDTPKPPEFDRAAWLEKAHAFMQKNGHQTLSNYDTALLKNIGSFERDVKRIIRRMDRNLRKPAEVEAEKAFTTLRELGRLPDTPNNDALSQVKELYDDALDNQKEIDQKFLRKFSQLRFTYIQGLDKQASFLRKEGNDEHADALDQEITATQKDMDRFIRILRGQDADKEND